MRKTLETAIKKALCIEIRLPDIRKGIDKTSITTVQDICMKNDNSEELAKVIYNGLVEYAVNEFKIDYDNLEVEQMKVLAKRIKYDSNATDLTKSKYGFYGEILLDLILRVFVKTNVLLARGYLYSPLEKAEVKGYDAFHLLEYNGNIELWLGEAKFYEDYYKPVKDVLNKISYSLSDEYVNANFLTIMDYQHVFSTTSSKLVDIYERWESNPSINISQEISNENMTIVYPIMIAYEKVGDGTYEDAIKRCIDYVEKRLRN